MERQLVSMKKQLLRYLIKLAFGISILVLCWLFFTNLMINMGVVIPANYSELVLEENKSKLLKIDKINLNDLPKGSKFVVLDYEYNKQYGNMNDVEIVHAINVVSGEENSLQGNYVYFSIPRKDDICVVLYHMKAYLNLSNDKYQVLDYDVISFVCIMFFIVLYTYFLTLGLVKTWKREFDKIEKMTIEIEKNNLDFQYSGSRISEFNHVIESIISMRDALKETLYLNWQMENEKIEQIGALIHDIKIPLTIIKGNTELMMDYNSDAYNLSHLSNSLESAQKIEKYIYLLLQYVREENIKSAQKKVLEAKVISNKICREIKKYIAGLDVQFEIISENIEGKLCVDYLSIERAILNIVDNSIQYRMENDKIVCRLGQENAEYTCSISNKLGKFNKEVLENAQKLFYTSNKSRDSSHYGIGLAYAKSVVQTNNGILSMYNCKTNGATVKIKLPLILDKSD